MRKLAISLLLVLTSQAAIAETVYFVEFKLGDAVNSRKSAARKEALQICEEYLIKNYDLKDLTFERTDEIQREQTQPRYAFIPFLGDVVYGGDEKVKVVTTTYKASCEALCEKIGDFYKCESYAIGKKLNSKTYKYRSENG